jgi:adenosylcobinamide kinase/adenosylcobinamide-phosphate guanylyltransferase
VAAQSASAGLVLVLGGARSGKSRYAEQLAALIGPRVLYVATAESHDAEMTERIRRHQVRRPSTWQTVEAPADPVRALEAAGSGWDAVLFECLSLWVSNLLLMRTPGGDEPDGRRAASVEEEILQDVQGLLEWQRPTRAPLIVVSNEVGHGVVPAYPLGRLYRDILGRANQRFAAEAEQVYYLVAGLGLELKALGASAVPPPR